MKQMSSQPPPPRTRFGPFEVDLRSGELRRHGVRLKLSGQPLEILGLLIANPGEVVTRDELRQRLWPGNTFVDFDHSLNAAVNKLREALGDSPEAPRYVETLPRRGYRFIARVESPSSTAAPALPPAPDLSEPAAAAEPPPGQRAFEEASRRAPSRVRPLVVAGVAAAAGFLLLLILAADARRHSARNGVEIRSLAVLPFENLSRDPEQEYFADGMTEALISRLSQVGALHVISRTSVMAYRDAKRPLPQIGKELKVEGIVEGAVQRSGNRVRITAKLIHAATDRNVWAGTYEEDLSDVLRLQSEVASAIAEEIRVRVTAQERTRLAWSAEVDPQVYQRYLKGRHFLARWASEKAAAEFREALGGDPKHAPSWVGLAEAELFSHPPRETMPRAKEAARRALALDSNLAEAHAMVGFVKTLWEWDWSGAEASFRRALTLNPQSTDIRHRYSHLLAATGRLPEAIAESRKAFELDPLSPNVGHSLGRLHYFARDYDRAAEQLRRAVDLDPQDPWAHFFLGITYEAQGRYAEALEHKARSAILSGASPKVFALLQEELGNVGYEAFRRRTLDWEAARAQMPLASSALALGYARLGDTEKALAWLEKAFQSHTRDLIYLKVEPSYDSLRGDPRFEAMLRRMGLDN